METTLKTTRRMAVAVFAVFALLVGCAEIPPVVGAPTANADVTPATPNVRQPVALDGSASSDPDGDPLTYTWSLSSQPPGSSATIADPNAETTSFIPDVPGDYTVGLTVSDGVLSDSDSATVTAQQLGADCSSLEVIDSNITADRTLAGSCYRVEGVRNISAALTVSPGVTVQFDQNAGFNVVDGGSLNAVGTAADPIVMTGVQESAGYWQGIAFQSDSFSNVLNHVDIAYAGSGNFIFQEIANVAVYNEGRVEITNTTIRDGAEFGLTAEANATIAVFSNNTFTGNQVPVNLAARLMGVPDSASSYTGNTEDYVRIYRNTVDQTLTVSNLDVSYRLNGISDVTAAVTIEAGTTLEFAQDAGLNVTSGSLNAVGAEANVITMRGVQQSPGYWRGLAFSSDDVDNELTYVDIAHAASDNYIFQNPANIAVYNEGRVQISNSTIRDSGNYGITTEVSANLSGFASNTFSGNVAAPMDIFATQIGIPDSASSFANNPEPYVRVKSATITLAANVDPLDVPYRFNGTSTIEAAVTVEPGTALEFAENAGLNVTSGSLNADGEPDNMITMTGSQETNGYWRGIAFTSDSVDNVLDHVDIAHGGGDNFIFLQPANIGLYEEGRLVLTNSTIRNSGGWGVWLEGGSAALFTSSGNTFTDNTSGSVGQP